MKVERMTKGRQTTESKQNLFTIILLIFLTLYTVSLIGVLAWGLMTSFKGQIDFMDHPYQLPEKFVNNLKTVFKEFKLPNTVSADGLNSRTIELPQMFFYSVLYALGSAVAATIIPCVTAYACARFPFRFSKIIYTTVIVAMIVPTVGNLPSELQMVVNFGLYNKIYGLWLLKANFLGMYFLVFYGVFASFPNSFTEAAKIDGANNLTIMIKIAFPLVLNVMSTVLLINFINFWNDYQTPLLYMPAYPTVAYGLFKLNMGAVKGNIAYVPAKLAASLLVVIPMLVLFVAFQGRLLGNLTVGGVKG